MQTNGQQLQQKQTLKGKIFKWLGLTRKVTIKAYNGYGHAEQLTIYGHVLKLGPKPRRKYRKNILTNTLALIRLFIVKPYPYAQLQLTWQDQVLTTKADEHGFFKFEWKDESMPNPGWHRVELKLLNRPVHKPVTAQGSIYIPYPTQYGFISDIDDTFLISHSANLRKRLFVLFTENARSRQPFEGSVNHYQLLAKGNTTLQAPNPFFYVSSSEWNLYDYILEFTKTQSLPRGVFLLNTLKRWYQLFKTGQNNHGTKFMRIARILKGYPKQRFVLLGDSSQHDPYIYASIVEHFPKQIHAVYIRDVHAQNRQKAVDVLHKIESAGVACCFFTHSSEAILHSKKIGLITEAEVIKDV